MFKSHRIISDRGFTIIELLVVITIISLLISILLPSLSRARASALRIVCSSNYRQLQVGTNAYATDSKDAAPWLNDGGYGALGYGGPNTQSAIATDPLCRFSNDYLNVAWSYNAATSRMVIPKILIDPGIVKGMYRPNPGWPDTTYTPEIGQWNGIGNTVGFGSFLGLYWNNCSGDRSGTGSNGGINARYRLRADGDLGDTWGANGINLLRMQDFLNPSSDVIFVDPEFQDGAYSTIGATYWSIPHGSAANRPDGINQGYADGSVRWFNHNQMNSYYQTAYPWSMYVKITPLCLDLNKPAIFNLGGYPTEWGWQPTTLEWYGVSTPNAGSGYLP